MRKEYVPERFHREAFIEFNLRSYELDKTSKSLVIYLDNAEYDDGVYIKNVIMKISNWTKLRVIETVGSQEEDIEPKHFISSIMEYHVFNDRVILRDVGMSSWIDWCFYECDITISGEPDDD